MGAIAFSIVFKLIKPIAFIDKHLSDFIKKILIYAQI